MHNAAFGALGLNWRYVPLPVPPGHVAEAVSGLVALGFRGANVTVPHKETVRSHLDALTPAAEMVGAVNTLVIDRTADGLPTVKGHNTDVPGFLAALTDANVNPNGQRVVVIGAGGAARAVVAALLTAKARAVTVLNRTAERAHSLVADLRAHADRTVLRAAPLARRTLIEATEDADLLVNATTVGMTPNVEASIWPDDVPVPSTLTVSDLVYAPRETRLLRQAHTAGARTVDGLGMLIHQGALAFDLWTGQAHELAEVTEAMFEAVRSTDWG
jgi:shikimate dehydrogenase